MTDQTTTAPVWQDGDPLMEAIAAAVWKHCRDVGYGLVTDDPRNIAAAAVAGIRDAAGQAAGQPVCACGHPQGRHNTACAHCPCVGYAETWPPQAAGQTPTTEQPVVGYRDPNNPRVLLCRQHGQSWHAITPVTAEDLPDGGICTFGRLSSNECGRDVLAGQAAVEQPAEAQPADQARAYDNLYAELTRGVSHAQVRHHLITEYRAEVLREAADCVTPDDICVCQSCETCMARALGAFLRRMADEATP